MAGATFSRFLIRRLNPKPPCVGRAAVTTVIVAVAVAAALASPWQKKDWKRWTGKECASVLSDSPWAQTVTLDADTLSASRVFADDPPYLGPQVWIPNSVTVQFRSALPVREAYVRLMQIQNQYDKMDPKRRAAFDQQAEAYLAQRSEDCIRIGFTGGEITSDPEFNRRFILSTFSLILPDGREIHPIRVVFPEEYPWRGCDDPWRSFEVIFPRVVKGEPVLKPGKGKMKVSILRAENAFNEQGFPLGHARVAKFKVSKMMYRGKLEY